MNDNVTMPWRFEDGQVTKSQRRVVHTAMSEHPEFVWHMFVGQELMMSHSPIPARPIKGAGLQFV